MITYKKHYMTGAIPTPRHLLIKAEPFVPPAEYAKQKNFLRRPKKLSYWLNDMYGTCVTAEEAYARGCADENAVFITDESVSEFVDIHDARNGAYTLQMMKSFSFDLGHWDAAGFVQNNDKYYYAGKKVYGVDWTDEDDLKQAILYGAVKVTVDSSLLKMRSTGPNDNDWICTDLEGQADDLNHVVSVSGFGTFSWLSEQLGTALPRDIDPKKQGYAMFTWNSIGIVDHDSLVAMSGEAWVRDPINRVEQLHYSDKYPKWDYEEVYDKGDKVCWGNRNWKSQMDENDKIPGFDKNGDYEKFWKEI